MLATTAPEPAAFTSLLLMRDRRGNGGLETRHRGTLKGQSGACLPARGFNLQIRQNCPSSYSQHFCIWAAQAGARPLSRIPHGARLLWMLRASPSPGLNLPWEKPRKPKGQEGACSSTAGGGKAEEHFTRGFVLYLNIHLQHRSGFGQSSEL